MALKLSQVKNTYQLIHMMQIMEELNNGEWQSFIDQGHMPLIFARIPGHVEDPLECRLLTLITRIITKYYLELASADEGERASMCKSLIVAYKSFISHTLSRICYPFRTENQYEETLTSNMFDIVKKCNQE